jgi:hypothetical protein
MTVKRGVWGAYTGLQTYLGTMTSTGGDNRA